MKQRGKRMVSFLLTVTLILSFFATVPQEGMKVQAASILEEYFEYNVSGDGVTITGYKKDNIKTDLDLITIFKNADKSLVKIDELACLEWKVRKNITTPE